MVLAWTQAEVRVKLKLVIFFVMSQINLDVMIASGYLRK